MSRRRPKRPPCRRRAAGALLSCALAGATLLLITPAAPAFAGNAPARTDSTLTFGRFGTVTLYRETPRPSRVVLFVSGDGGWNLGVVDMARELASLDALVVGIDITHYLKQLEAADEPCSYAAADLEALSQFVQKKLGFARYTTPVLVGYSSGATLVYAALVQAPPGTFRGAVSMGFCPDLPLVKPFCKGNGLTWTPGPRNRGFSFSPATTLRDPWIAFQGTEDQVCDPAAVQRFVSQVAGGEVVLLPKVGHGFSVPRNWLSRFTDTFKKLSAVRTATETPKPAAVQDLPLVELPAGAPASDVLAVILTGDGGWASLDRQIGEYLSAHGVSVVGWSSLQYFWTARTPEGASRDLERVLRHYLDTWGKKRILLVGYSMGADALPAMTNRLPADLLDQVALVALLGVSPKADFEFHVGDWLESTGGAGLPVRPEIEKLRGTHLLCFYGADEKDSLCPGLPAGLATAVEEQGGHHLGGAYEHIAGQILQALGR